MATAITMEQVKSLREKTSGGILDCKKALEEAGGDEEKAIEILRKKGLLKGETKAGRATANGAIGSYIHGGRIGVMVEVACETDFVAKNDAFQAYLKDLCMHIAAADPRPVAVSRDSYPQELIEKERRILEESDEIQKKPADKRAKIVDGKINKFLQDRCLMEQPWVRDPQRKIEDLHKEIMGKFGENMIIHRFVRWVLGEG